MKLNDFLIGGKNQELNDIMGKVAVLGSLWSAFGPKKLSPVDADNFSLAKFTALIKEEGSRVAKGYYYKVVIFGPNDDASRRLVFNTTKVTMPGWKTKSQRGKIYALDYEIPIGLEQDSLWITFGSDIKQTIEKYFMTATKGNIFNTTNNDSKTPSFSPRYKDTFNFNVSIYRTDENFKDLVSYSFNGCFIKTVQNISLGSNDTSQSEVTCEIVYETVQSYVWDEDAPRPKAKAQKTAADRNKLKIGPFQADLTELNQVVDGFGAVPGWFESPDKL